MSTGAGFSTTMDASHKVTASGSGRSGLVHHVFRDVDDAVGQPREHRGPNIDRSRTQLNRSCVNDGSGSFREVESVDDIDAYLDRRLAAVKPTKRTRKDGTEVEVAQRKDAVIMRPLVLQLDPQWYEQNMPDWRDGQWTDEHDVCSDAMLTWAANEFGQENIVGAAWHMDEVNPQLQILMTPITEDGRLSQKDFFKGPADFKRQHMEFRQAMRDVGYDASMKVTTRSKEHLSSQQLAAKSEKLGEKSERLDAREADLDAKEKDLSAREEKLSARERSVALRDDALTVREQKNDRRESMLTIQENTIAARLDALPDLTTRVEQLSRRIDGSAPDQGYYERIVARLPEDAQKKWSESIEKMRTNDQARARKAEADRESAARIKASMAADRKARQARGKDDSYDYSR